MATCILVTLLALGMPLSWKKTELNTIIKWLGFNIDINALKVTILADKMSIIQGQLQKVIEGIPPLERRGSKASGKTTMGNGSVPTHKTMAPTLLVMDDGP